MSSSARVNFMLQIYFVERKLILEGMDYISSMRDKTKWLTVTDCETEYSNTTRTGVVTQTSWLGRNIILRQKREQKQFMDCV